MQTAIIANEQSQNRHSQMSNKYKTKKNIKKTLKTKQRKKSKQIFFFYKDQQSKHTKKREKNKYKINIHGWCCCKT